MQELPFKLNILPETVWQAHEKKTKKQQQQQQKKKNKKKTIKQKNKCATKKFPDNEAFRKMVLEIFLRKYNYFPYGYQSQTLSYAHMKLVEYLLRVITIFL